MGSDIGKIFGGPLTQEGISLPSGGWQSANQARNTIPDASWTAGGNLNPQPTVSTIQRPSFIDAVNSGPGGLPNALSPALTTKGKVLATVLSAAKGGLASIGEKTAGQGFQTGLNLPFVQAQQKQGIQRGALENQMLQGQVANAPILARLGIAGKQADITKTQAETAALPAKQALEEAQTLASRYKEDPGSGALIDLQTMQTVNGGNLIPVQSKELAGVLNVPVGTKVPIARAQKAATLLATGATTVPTDEGVFDYNRITGNMKKLGGNPRNVFSPANRFGEFVDPNDPQNTVITTYGQAAKQGMSGTKSTGFKVEQRAGLQEVPTKIGDQKVAFTTAIQHADLLRQAVRGLANGDQQTLNDLKNRFKNEFGSSGPVTAQAVADAYQREVTSILSKGHMTNEEIRSVGKTLNPNKQNWNQIDSVLGAYQSLAQSKMNMLNQQKTSAIKQSQTQGGNIINYKIVNGELVRQ